MKVKVQFSTEQPLVFAEQDAGLEELSKIISRQKNIARTIGEEVDTQNGKFKVHYISQGCQCF